MILKFFIHQSRRLYKFFFALHDPIALCTYRVLSGLAMFSYFIVWWQNSTEWLTTQSFHISGKALLAIPVWPALPPDWLPFFGFLFFGSLIAWTLGLYTRITCPLLWACVLYINHVDVFSAYTLNKFFALSMTLMLFTKHDAYWSFHSTEPRPQAIWPVRIFQMTLILHYFFAGYAKAFRGDWLKNPNVLWSHVQGLYMTDLAAQCLDILPLGVWSLLQYLALTFEIAAPILFCIRYLRPVGIFFGISFQGLVVLFMEKLIFFSTQMLTWYVFFVSEQRLHRIRLSLKSLSSRFLAKSASLEAALFTAPSNDKKTY